MVRGWIDWVDDGRPSLQDTAIRAVPLSRIFFYLIHFAVLLCVTPAILAQLQLISGFAFGLWLAGFIVTIAVTVLLAVPAYAYIEVPSVSLGKWIIKRVHEKIGGR